MKILVVCLGLPDYQMREREVRCSGIDEPVEKCTLSNEAIDKVSLSGHDTKITLL